MFYQPSPPMQRSARHPFCSRWLFTCTHVSDAHELHTLQAIHPPPLGPPPVVADEHPDYRALVTPGDGLEVARLKRVEAEVARVEVTLLELIGDAFFAREGLDRA